MTDAPTGCIAPAVGARVRALLGEDLPPQSEASRHVEDCLACALERRAWQEAEARALPVSTRLLERVLARAEGQSLATHDPEQ